MPFYEYINREQAGCDHCRAAFTVLQRLNDPVIEFCPACHAPVRRLISPPNVVAGQAHKLKESNIEKAGFTQYKENRSGCLRKDRRQGPGGDQCRLNSLLF